MLMMTNLLSLLFAMEIMFIGNALGYRHDEVSYDSDIIVLLRHSSYVVTI